MVKRIMLIAPGTASLPPHRSTSVELYLYDLWRALRPRVDTCLYGAREKLDATRRGTRRVALPKAEGTEYLGEVIGDIRNSQHGSMLLQADNRPLSVLRLRSVFPRAPIVLNLHSTTFVADLARSTFRRIADNADGIIVNSEYVRRELSSRAGSTHRSTVILPGVDTTLFHPPQTAAEWTRRDELRRRFGAAGRPLILYAGRIIARKGVDIAIEATRLLRAGAEPAPVLWIVGRPPHPQSSYGRLLRRRSSGVDVRFLGYAKRESLADIYRAADLFVCPSQRSEAFGLVNLEAQASGLPVVASRNWGISEAVDDGTTGWLIERYRDARAFASAVSELLADERLRESMGRAARQRAEREFGWERAAQDFLNFYAEVCRYY